MNKIKKRLARLLRGKRAADENERLRRQYDSLENEPEIICSLDKETKQELRESIRAGIWTMVAQQERRIALRRWKIWRVSLGMAAGVAVVLTITLYFFGDARLPENRLPDMVYYTADENSMIVLPDNSGVLLSGGSKLGYPAAFADTGNRRVELEGQAFFNVQSDVRRPFIVNTADLNVRVLGTSFNVRALPSEKLTRISVHTGSVGIEHEQQRIETLKPRQELSYDAEAHTFNTHTLQWAAYLDWQREGALRFENTSVEQACAVFERIFDVSFAFEEAFIKDMRFTTRFAEGESLEKVLTSICAFTDTRFRLAAANRVVLSKN